MVTRQLQVERKTAKVRRSKTDVLPTVPRNQYLHKKTENLRTADVQEDNDASNYQDYDKQQRETNCKSNHTSWALKNTKACITGL